MTEEAEERIDRYRTLNNAAFGLALGLGAFSLTGFPIEGLMDIVMALGLFANAFLIILGIWHDVHRMLKYPFGMSFAFLDYLLIFLVVIMPFTFRLIFEVGEVVEIAVTLYPLNVMASQIVLATMYQMFVRHNRDILPRELVLWGKESRNCVFIIAVFYAASVFLPSEVLELMPLPPGAPSFLQRLFLWWLGYPIMIIYGVIYEKVHGIKWASRE
ncbi:MAG: hypothetical protein OEX77_08370 [Candidatus Bathyarchaeota archaeon]|nr:hypothetical protein [Candidatus Bathyarchaeota archaeon]MDH5732759.1 hypothetical protein [Candidatus Bathyarchaeota archaeon]